MSAINACGLVFARFVFHNAAQIDTQLAAMFTQLRTTIQQQGGPAQAPVLAWLNIPEDRLGLLLLMSAFVLIIYLGLSALGGAFAALLRSRARPITRKQLHTLTTPSPTLRCYHHGQL